MVVQTVGRSFAYWLHVYIFSGIFLGTIFAGMSQSWPLFLWLAAIGVILLYGIPLVLEGLVTAGIEVTERTFTIHSYSLVDGHESSEVIPFDDYEKVIPAGFYFPNAIFLMKSGARIPMPISYSQGLSLDFIIQRLFCDSKSTSQDASQR